jgi:hypothetical protein
MTKTNRKYSPPYRTNQPSNFCFTELTADALTDGRPFDGLAVGEFTDMHGRAVTIARADLPTYVENTLAAIAATQGESGELAGLPIDARDHEKGDGAGWIVGASTEGDLIRLVPQWTEIGRDLVARKIRRFFSATVDLANKVILGGTLTNWPATRDGKGRVMLRPIELAHGIFQLSDGGMEEQVMKVRRAFYEAYAAPAEAPMVDEVFPDHAIVEVGEKKFKAAYSVDDAGTVVFAPREEWVEVVETYVEARAQPPATQLEDEPMALKLADMSAEDRAALTAAVVAQLQPLAPPTTPPPQAPTAALPVDLAQVLGVDVLSDEGKKKIAHWMEQQAKAVQEQAQLAFNGHMARIQRETQVADLARRVTSGTPDAPRGLKNVKADELQRRLLALPHDEAQFWGGLLEGVVKDGLVNYAELGHGKQLTGVAELPAEVAKKLDSGEFTLADLKNPILGLGDLAQYNLSAYTAKK